MAATITIYGKNGSSHEVVPEASSVRKMELMKEDYIRLVFTTKYKININLGDYITHETWGTFYITKPQKGVYNKNTGGYDYDLQFDAAYYKWNNKLYKFEPGTKRNEASWSLTDKLENHMAVFLRNLTHHGWNYTVDPLSYEVDGVDKAVFIQFDNKYMLDALTQIAEAFNVEWWITDTVIHFGKAEHGTAVQFEVGVNVEEMSAEKSSGDYISRLYAFGAARNLPPDYRKNDEQVLLNGVVQKRVMMPELTPYVDIENGLTDDEIVEGIVLFDDVYPRTESAITQVTEVVKPIEANDSTTEATTDEVDENDEEQETATFYRFKKNGFLFSKDYILAGQTLQIQFTSGLLNGMTFDLAFNPDGLPEKTYTHGDQDERVEIDNPDAQVFEIVRNDTYGLFLPNETLKPQVNDTFVLLGWDITKVEDGLGLVTAAENELYQRAQDYAARLKKDPLTYPCTMMADYMYGLTGGGQQDPNYSKVGTFELGQRIQLVSDAYFDGGVRVSRVVGFEYKLDKPYDGAVIYVGESATYSGKKDSQAKLNEAVNSINYRNSEYGATGAGGSFYVIGTNDTTTPGDSNVYSALRSDRQYARKNKNDVISSLWTFKHGNGLRRGLQTQEYNGVGSNEDNLFGKGFELISKTNAQGDVRTRLEVDELFVRIKAFFAKLEIREISYVGGNYCFSAAGSRIYYVDWIDASGNVIDKTIGNIADVYKFRCYLYSDDGTTATINKWAIDDQVMCRTFNIDSGVHQNVSNKYYWRRVTGIGRGVIPSQVVTPEYSDDEVTTPTEYQYVDISMADCATGSDYPEAEDAIVQFGNWSNSARQGVIYLMVEGESAPAIMEYSGVGANGQHFVLPDPTLLLSPTKNVIYGEFHSVVDSGGGTGGGDTIDDQIQALIDALNDIKNQADKKMEMWFGAYVPLPNSDNPNATANYPASEWTTDELKALHAQDLFYDTYKAPATQRGRAWRWIAAEGANNTIVYYWDDVTDQDTIDALEKIADVASDGLLTGGAEKVRVFLDWERAVEEYLKYTEQAHDYGITTQLTEYRTAFKALAKMLNDGVELVTSDTMTSIPTPAWLQNLQTETTIPSPTTYRTRWTDYYTTLAALLKEIQRIAKALADAAQEDATSALNKIGDMANDGKLDPTEKLTVKREFIAAYHEMMDTDEAGYQSGILDMAKDENGQWLITYSTWIAPYINAFRALGTYLNGGTSWTEPALSSFNDSALPSWIQSANMGNTQNITGDTWRSKWSDFYTKRTAVLTALTDHAQGTADDAHDRIDDVVSDGILSGGAEKSAVFIDWMRCVQEYLKYTQQASDYSVSSTAYVTAYTALATMLNGGTAVTTNIKNGTDRPAWLTTTNILLDTTLSDYSLTADQYRAKWNDYYVQLTLLIEAIGDKVKSLADDALEELDNMADDDVLTEFEKLICLRDWEAARAEKTSLVAQFANDPNASTTTLVNSFNLLSHYLDNKSMTDYSDFTGTAPALLVTSGDTTIDGDVFKLLWKNYYDARSSLLASVSSSKVSMFVQSTRPNPPYKVGDLWVQTNNDNNIMVCVMAKTASQTGADSDWADLSDITEKRDPRILIAAMVSMYYSYYGGFVKELTTNQYIKVHLGTRPSTGSRGGEIAYYSSLLYQWDEDDGYWTQIGNDSLKTTLAALYEVTGDYTLRVFRATPNLTLQLYDIICSPLTFTDSNLPSSSPYKTVEGGIQIKMYNGSQWEILQEAMRSLIENLPGYVRALAMKSADDYSTAAGFITSGDWATLFAQATDADGNKIAEAHMSAFVTKNSNGVIQSGVSIGADQIIFTGKQFSIDADHINLTGTDNISLLVGGVRSDLANTGINIQEGKITLNADNTTITGNLALNDPNRGLVIYDAYGNPKISVLNNTIGSLESYDLGGDKSVGGTTTKTRTSTSQKIQATFALSFGTFTAGQSLKMHDLVLRAYQKNNPFDTNISSITYSYELKCGTTVVKSASGTATRKTSGFDFDGFSVPDYTNNSVGYSGEYILNLSFEVTLASSSQSLLGDFHVNAHCYCRKVLAGIIQVATDGAMFASSNVAYNWFGSDKTQFRNGAAGLRLINGRIQRNVSYADYPSWNNNWADISTMVPTEIVNALTYTADENDGLIAFSTVIGESDSAKRTLTLPSPSNLRGKVYYIKNIAGDNTEIRCVSSDSIIPPNSSGYTNTVNCEDNSMMAISVGFGWILFYCG